jgi:TolA-binding protein
MMFEIALIVVGLAIGWLFFMGLNGPQIARLKRDLEVANHDAKYLQDQREQQRQRAERWQLECERASEQRDAYGREIADLRARAVFRDPKTGRLMPKKKAQATAAKVKKAA